MHQVFLHDTTLALVLIDPTRGRAAMDETRDWNKRLEKHLERIYNELIPQAREVADHMETAGRQKEADCIRQVIENILDRPEHQWFVERVEN